LEADSATFRETKLRLRCEAWLFKLYRRSSEELELYEDTPQLASVLGQSIAGGKADHYLSREALTSLCWCCSDQMILPDRYMPTHTRLNFSVNLPGYLADGDKQCVVINTTYGLFLHTIGCE